ncbi:uncharacterized protein LOC127004400 [Eriocheir sinensis]|uniref:uncharacterized protein LOC127004400 n=1 Tax=Eriocheir sinensis TaxID=95602 RepID=UPI0021C8F222|nr:uncharacterized protein LOC127004400 [Eriocheir sinensis]
MGNRRVFDILCFAVLSAVPGESSIWDSLTPALDRAASYGYYLMGYGPPTYAGYHDGVDFPINPGTIWNGHIPVGDFVSPIISALGSGQGGYSDRVVKGYENRLGLRVALPYLGDFQVTRELGPGKFLDKLGPGKFPYPGLQGVKGQHKASSGQHHEYAPAPSTTHAPDMYNGLKNYPWYRRRR